METITSTEEDNIASQVEIDDVYPSAAKPGKKRGRPKGSKNLSTFEARRVNKRVLAQAHYERNKAVSRVTAELNLNVGSATNSGRKRGRPRGSKNRPKPEPLEADEQLLSQAEDAGKEERANLDGLSAANRGGRRGRPRGSKNRPKPEPLEADEQLLSQAEDGGKEERTNLDGLSAANPGGRRGRPRGSKNRPKPEPLKADEQLLSQGEDEGTEERKYLGGLSAANPGRKRGRPRGSKNRPKPEPPKPDEWLQGRTHHDREEERTYLAKVTNPVSFSDKRQQHVARVPEYEAQENESSKADKPWRKQGARSPYSADSVINHAPNLRSSAKNACSPDKPIRKRKQYKRLDLPGPSNVPYKDTAGIAASQQWRADRESQARRFARLEKILAANDQESNMESEPRQRRRQRVSGQRGNFDKEKLDEMTMVEGDTEESCTINGDTGSEDSDGGSDAGELQSLVSWVPLSVASRPVGFLGQVREHVGFLPKPSRIQVGVPQPMMY